MFQQWPPRDWRKLLALILLAGGGMALTVVAWRTTTLVGERSAHDPWPLAYALYGALALIGIVLLSFGWVLGKTSISGTVLGNSFNASGGGDDGAGDPICDGDQVTVTKDAAPKEVEI